MGKTLATYPSSSNPNVSYNIIEGADSNIYCQCQGWKMRKNCKHLKDYLASNGSIACTQAPKPTLTTPKSTVAMVAPKDGPMISGKIDPDVFKSDAFQSMPFYQGCGGKIEGDMDAIEVELAKLERSGKYTIESKRDGIFCAAFSDGEKVRFWSRNQKEKPYGLNNWKLPAGTLLVGELGFGSEYALQLRAQYGFDFCDIHDIIILDYESLMGESDQTRRAILESFVAKLDGPTRERFRLVPRWTSGFVDKFKAEHEGLVLKTNNEPYTGRGTKVSHWIKAKKWETTEMVILSRTMSSAETKNGLIESITCGAYVDGKLKPLVKVGSMPSDWQKEFADNFETYKGKVVELAHFGQFSSGSLRHPSFMRLRDDKDASECFFEGKKDE